MGKVDVQFDNNPQAIYQPGDVIQGSVILNLTEKLKTEGIKVKCSGKARVRWSEGGGQHRRYYSGFERYHGDEILVNGQFANSQELPAGCHTFPFRFQLKAGIPASFLYDHGVTGKVYYHIKVVVIKPWSFNITFKKPFTVFRVLDLNIQPDAVRERRNQKEKYICCLCCRSGPLSANVHVTREGYVSGDTVTVSGEVENLSSRRLSKCLVTLSRRYDFHATSKTRSEEEYIQSIKGPEVHPGGSHICRELLTIPTGIPPSFLIGCNIIDIHYYVSVIADPAGCALDLKVPVEIVVGTIPHASVASETAGTAGFSSGFPSTGYSQGPVPVAANYTDPANQGGTFNPSTSGFNQPGDTGRLHGYDNYSSAFSYDK